ncbi:MAG: sulfatase-like hydrolase/transferase [Bacteroidales bacterium]|nr:sulfatase-like hydrolase/transferase [Bacteroidales bacterium]
MRIIRFLFLNKKEETAFYQRITIVTIIALLAYKTVFLAISHNPQKEIFIISFFHDSALLLLNYFFFRFFILRFPGSKKILIAAYLFVFVAFSLTVFIYTPFIFDLLNFPINIFSVQAGNVAFFFNYFLSLSLIIPGFIILVIVVVFSIKYPKRISRLVIPVSTVVVLLVFSVTATRPSLNPIIFSISDEIRSAMQKDYGIYRIKINQPASGTGQYPDQVNKSFTSYPVANARYSKVIVLVMESICYDDFMDPMNYRDGGFLAGIRESSISFSNYYTTNLDSYTSLISMLNSTFVPYQAYVNEDKYRFVNKRKNLVRFFNKNDFQTMFLTSYGNQQKRFVPDIQDWDRVHCVTDFSNKFHSITTNKIEAASEDFAVFPDLVKFVKENKKAFVLQEMVYGHTAGWKEKTGLGTLEYYKRYFRALYDTIAKENLLNQTLLVITADHGPRQDAKLLKNYKIPMIFISPGQKSRVIPILSSHLDFKDILLQVLQGNEIHVTTDEVLTVGNSGNYDYGQIKAGNRYIFINNRTLNVKTNMTAADVKSLACGFQKYIDYFQTLKNQ